MSALSPMMQQYFEIKNKYKGYILFFRLGDFYEMFFDDAKIASKELELTLTGRDCGLEKRAPMCGIPYHSYESYVSKLIEKGYKIAICEQLENPSETKKLVKRDVVRVITPGTIIENNMLDDNKNNFISSVFADEDGVGVCFSDISTGEIFITTLKGKFLERELINELSSFYPSEMLVNSFVIKMPMMKKFIETKLSCLVNVIEEDRVDIEKISQDIFKFFKKESLSALGFSNQSDLQSIKALGALIDYFKFTYKVDNNNLSTLNFYQSSQYMNIDISAKKSLEITENIKTQEKKKSLLGVLDKTKTPMGKRMMKKFIEQPLINSTIINQRLESVNELVNNSIIRMSLTESLSIIYDIERLLTRIIFKTITPRELQSFKYTIGNIKELKKSLNKPKTMLLKKLFNNIDELNDIYKLIDDAIVESPPAMLKDGEVIKDGFNLKVDEYRDILKNSKKYLAEIEQEEKIKTGIKTLKIGYNRVFGYYIEVSKSFADKVPQNYIRKQTLTNGERYIVEKLKEIEEKILHASEKVVKLESEIFDKIIESISSHMLRVQKTASAISNIDVLCSLANVAVKNNYVKPVIDNSDIIDIKDGRHPIIESILKESPFVPNDTKIDLREDKISIITGPNMAGKSTYMRQVALIVLMSQIGSFVPASYAHIGVVDGIFTRIGASDDLSSGQSTFMVEMNEISYIIKNMTNRSLIILDEIGRGTSTYDGMSIAGAIIEYIASNEKNGGKTLFATHYHELADMPNKFLNVKNYSIAVKKNGDDIIFLHRIVPKSTDKSYGLEVAKLAGIPSEIISRAKEILLNLESNTFNYNSNSSPQSNLNNVENNKNFEIVKLLSKIDPEVLSPLESLNYIYKLKSLLK